MRRERVNSRTIASIGYDDAETLEVEFVSGSVYRYDRVQEEVYEDFRQAASKGQFFNEHIKDAYSFVRVK